MRYVKSGLLLLASLFACGCEVQGVKTYPVSGKVVFSDGTPVAFGRIEFYHPEHDLTSRGTIQKDGTFELGTFADGDGAPAGMHEVVVAQLIMPGEAGITPHEHGRHIDSRYSRYETSGLQFHVEASAGNEFRIEVDP